MRALKLAIRTLCIIPFATGIADMVDGVGLLDAAGARLGSVSQDPVLNSQVGFWGAIWFGFGIILWRASSHLVEEAVTFRLLSATLFLSGLARLGSAAAYGSPGPILTTAIVVEIAGGAGLLIWHGASLGRQRSDAVLPG